MSLWNNLSVYTFFGLKRRFTTVKYSQAKGLVEQLHITPSTVIYAGSLDKKDLAKKLFGEICNNLY